MGRGPAEPVRTCKRVYGAILEFALRGAIAPTPRSGPKVAAINPAYTFLDGRSDLASSARDVTSVGSAGHADHTRI
jgi:hypothetical protein